MPTVSAILTDSTGKNIKSSLDSIKDAILLLNNGQVAAPLLTSVANPTSVSESIKAYIYNSKVGEISYRVCKNTSTLPYRTLICNGTVLLKSDYSDLFDQIGHSCLPNMAGSFNDADDIHDFKKGDTAFINEILYYFNGTAWQKLTKWSDYLAVLDNSENYPDEFDYTTQFFIPNLLSENNPMILPLISY